MHLLLTASKNNFLYSRQLLSGSVWDESTAKQAEESGMTYLQKPRLDGIAFVTDLHPRKIYTLAFQTQLTYADANWLHGSDELPPVNGCHLHLLSTRCATMHFQHVLEN